MTIHIFVRDASAQEKLSSRPEESWACGPPKVMKNTFCPPTALLGSIALPFVIPSVAEGSAVPRTIPGNVFRQSVAKWRDLLLKPNSQWAQNRQPDLTLAKLSLVESADYAVRQAGFLANLDSTA